MNRLCSPTHRPERPITLVAFGIGTTVIAGATHAQDIHFESLNYRGIFHAQAVVGVDLNQDGLSDLGILGEDRFHVAIDDGPGSALVLSRPLTGGRGPLFAADLDGDGHSDFVHREQVDGRVVITALYNAGRGASPEVSHVPLESGYLQPWCVSDLDGDGLADIVLNWKYWSRKPQVRTLMSRSRGEFEASVLYSHPESWRLLDVVAGDFDGDGDNDLIAIYGQVWYFNYYAYSGEAELQLLANDGEGGFSLASRHPLPWRDSDWIPQRVAIGDIDGNGDLDAVVVAANENVYDEFQALPLINVEGELIPGTMSRFGGVSSVTALILRDLNVDGQLDLVTMGANHWSEQPGFWVLPNVGDGRFGSPAFHALPFDGRAMRVADMPADGRWDLLIAGGNSVLVMRNTSPIGNVRLENGPLVRGAEVTLTVRRADPGEMVGFLGSLSGSGYSRGIQPLGGITLDLNEPIQMLGSAVADGNGVAEFYFTVPPNAPLAEVVLQAVIRRGPGGVDSVKTPFRTARITD